MNTDEHGSAFICVHRWLHFVKFMQTKVLASLRGIFGVAMAGARSEFSLQAALAAGQVKASGGRATILLLPAAIKECSPCPGVLLDSFQPGAQFTGRFVKQEESMRQLMRCRVILVTAALLGVTAGAAAQTLGEITGVVRDSSGAVIPGATVAVTNPATNATRTVMSNEAGVYRFPALQPGTYTIKVEMAGFRTITQTGVELQVQQSARIDFSLQVGQVAETIEVSGTAALIASENATVGTVIENRRIVDLPLNGRNFLQLVSLSSNVSFGFQSAGQAGSRQGGTRSTQNISVAGQRSMFNRFTLDGVENTDVNFNTYVILPSVDALQEFKVQSGIFPAEFGRATSQINVSTKPGTNQFHGTLFEFLRNDKLDAKQYAFAGERPKDAFKWNQYGFTVGGPVTIPGLYKGTDRLFFMSNFEGFNERRKTRTLYSVPSMQMRGGDFSEIISLTNTTIYDPATTRPDPCLPGGLIRDPFAGNLIPTNRINSVSNKLLEFYPAPNLNPNLVPYNYEATLNRKADKDQFIQRIDFTESSKSSWFGRYSWSGESEATPFFFNGSQVQTHVHQTIE